MTPADTYNPLPISTADLRRLKEAFRDHAPVVALGLGYSDTGMAFVSVTVPGDDFDDAPPCITRGERGWQMHRGGNGPLYEFATEREVVEFVGSGGLKETWSSYGRSPSARRCPATTLRAAEQGTV